MPTKQIISNFASSLKDLCFPPVCLLCKVSLRDSSVLICSNCLKTIPFSVSPLCPQCGKVFISREGGDHLCSTCRQKKLFYDRARSLFLYNSQSAPLIHAFKYGGCTAGLKTFARLKEEKNADAELSPPSLIIPVPLHKKRLRHRGYNQALLLAQALFPLERAKIDPFVLRRDKDTGPQTSLSGRQRRRNPIGAFRVAEPEKIEGRSILLIDDVLTTGTTVNECARVLSRAGAERVEVFTLARVRE
ncbi:MAG: ComF family protein [Desulfurivibrionaceae bacterium]